MMSSSTDLNIIRKKLGDALGDNFKIYLSNMKLWFRQKTTKEDFDIEARKLLSPDTVGLHNEFLLAIFNKCQSLCSSHTRDSSISASVQNRDKLKKGKRKKKCRPIRATFEHRFQPVGPMSYAPAAVPKDPQEDTRLSFCSRELTLPDTSMVHGRMFVTAWDCGLDGVEDDAVKLIMLAVRQELKSILMALFSRRSAYRLRERKFQYLMGAPPINPYIRNSQHILHPMSESNATSVMPSGEHVPSVRPTKDWVESEAALEVACNTVFPVYLPPVSALDLLEALQVHRSCIASHTVYAINLERTIARIWHPSHEDLMQEDIHCQEQALKQQIAAEQSAFR